MQPDPRSGAAILVDGYLDETLSSAEHDELAAWIRADPAHARVFAEAVVLHDRLHAEMLAAEMLAAEVLAGEVLQAAPRAAPSRRSHRSLAGLFAAICLLLAVGFVGWRAGSSSARAASVALEQIIRANEHLPDRTYVIVAQDGADDGPPHESRDRAPKPPVDGAMLHVRGADHYVLERFYEDGTRFVTGSDGLTSWAVPPRGRVRVSQDLGRFRGAVPGQQHAIPFVDINTSLRQLAESYALTEGSAPSAPGRRQIVATRKPTASGGPKRVTITYDATSRVIHSMVLERLPQARGGPRTALLELVEMSDLGPAFFKHATHHDAAREVIEE